MMKKLVEVLVSPALQQKTAPAMMKKLVLELVSPALQQKAALTMMKKLVEVRSVDSPPTVNPHVAYGYGGQRTLPVHKDGHP